MNPAQQELIKCLGTLFSTSLKITSPVGQLHLIREKIMVRSYQSFDNQDILDELGRLQHITEELHKAMLQIHILLQKSNH